MYLFFSLSFAWNTRSWIIWWHVEFARATTNSTSSTCQKHPQLSSTDCVILKSDRLSLCRRHWVLSGKPFSVEPAPLLKTICSTNRIFCKTNLSVNEFSTKFPAPVQYFPILSIFMSILMLLSFALFSGNASLKSQYCFWDTRFWVHGVFCTRYPCVGLAKKCYFLFHGEARKDKDPEVKRGAEIARTRYGN